jgi:DNA-binding NtrC family response regulator
VPYKEARGHLLDRFEGTYVRAVLARHQNNISNAAKAAGIARRYFKELMRKHGIYEELRPQLSEDDDEP